MSLIPAAGGTHQAWAHAWETIRYALDSNSRTARLCVILLVLGLTGITPFVVMALAHYALG